MSRPSDSTLLNHIFSQTQANVSFLASQGYISATEASDILSRLTTAQSRAPRDTDVSLANSMQALSVAPVPPAGPAPGPLAGGRTLPPPTQSRLRQARALWGYNEDGTEPNDLSFSGGEVVEILDENNADWWTGRCRGRQGLFPSNHVEKIESFAPRPAAPTQMPMGHMVPSASPPISHSVSYGSSPSSTAPYAPPASPGGYGNEKPVYRPFGAVYQGNDQPPPNTVAATNSVGLQQAPGQEQKKSKYGRLGNTMANSAAGGVGFGAGAAIGSGIINAIF